MIRFALALVATSALVFLGALPFHAFKSNDFEGLLKVAQGPKDIVFYGNSVIKAASRCDSDSRAISEILAANTKRAVTDASRGGMNIGMMLSSVERLAALGFRPRTVIIPVSLEIASLSTVTDGDFLNTYLQKNLGMNKAAGSPLDQVIRFNDRHFGSYKDFSNKEFVLEKKNANCPEHLGFDREFVQFMYFRNFLSDNLATKIPDIELKNRVNALVKRGVDIVFVLMPVNIGDIATLHGDEAVKMVKQRVGIVREVFSPFPFIDLSEQLGEENFSDRWCACGHLTQTGRLRVAYSVAGFLNSRR